jgi:hypothetical protein
VPTWKDVVEIASAFPGVEEYTPFGSPAIRVRKKFIARLRTNPDALVIRVIDLLEAEALLKGQPEIFFSTPHYDGHPYVLVHLDKIGRRELAELIEDAWRTQAPKRLIAEYDGRG